MKKLVMALVAVVGSTFAFPVFAEDAPKAEGGEKKKGGKKHKKAAEGEAKPAEGAK